MLSKCILNGRLLFLLSCQLSGPPANPVVTEGTICSLSLTVWRISADSTLRRDFYNSRLCRYHAWCTDREIDPFSTTVGQVADFLLEVFQDGLCIRTVKAYHTAIGALHRGFEDGSSVSTSPLITSLLKGMFVERPSEQVLVPDWDLPLVLEYLASDSFEPLGKLSLLDLSRKTAFLVAVACGRHGSEIQALSIDEPHLLWRRDGVSLLPRAGFLAKNQTMSFTPKPVFLLDLALVARALRETVVSCTCP